MERLMQLLLVLRALSTNAWASSLHSWVPKRHQLLWQKWRHPRWSRHDHGVLGATLKDVQVMSVVLDDLVCRVSELPTSHLLLLLLRLTLCLTLALCLALTICLRHIVSVSVLIGIG